MLRMWLAVRNFECAHRHIFRRNEAQPRAAARQRVCFPCLRRSPQKGWVIAVRKHRSLGAYRNCAWMTACTAVTVSAMFPRAFMRRFADRGVPFQNLSSATDCQPISWSQFSNAFFEFAHGLAGVGTVDALDRRRCAWEFTKLCIPVPAGEPWAGPLCSQMPSRTPACSLPLR